MARKRLVMQTKAPTHKLLAGVGAGSTSAVLIGKKFGHLIVYFLGQALGHPLPDDVGSAIEDICEFVIGGGLGLLAGYYTPPSPNDVPVEVEDGR